MNGRYGTGRAVRIPGVAAAPLAQAVVSQGPQDDCGAVRLRDACYADWDVAEGARQYDLPLSRSTGSGRWLPAAQRTSLMEKLPKKPGDSTQRAYFMTLRLYVDDSVDSDEYRLRLAAAGYEVISPRDVGMIGVDDRLHLEYAFHCGLVLLTHDADDFEELHLAGEPHSGIMWLSTSTTTGGATCVPPRYCELSSGWSASGLPIVGELHVLNHWRS